MFATAAGTAPAASLDASDLAASDLDALDLPLPRWEDAAVAIAPPGDGPGFWVGAPSVVLADGVCYLAYRLRRPVGRGRGYCNVIARSDDGVHFETLCILDRDAIVMLYDGRANAAENWEERTGVAVGSFDALHALGDAPAAQSPSALRGLRYVDAVAAPGGCRIYYEATRDDGAHELRTELLPAPSLRPGSSATA